MIGDPTDMDETPRTLGDAALQSQTLEDVGNAVNYHRWLCDLARPYLGDHPVELGAGLGDYAGNWLAGGLPRITLCEREEVRYAGLRERFGGDPRVTVTDFDVYDPPQGEHSAFVAFNVLEHLERDADALRAAHRLLAPGGAVVMFVPAFEFAMSDFDRAVGHVRRYRKRTLREAYERAGLELELLHYVNAPGLAAWFAGMRLLRMTPGDGPLLRVWDGGVVPVARAVERRVRPPFGQSVFAVGRVPR